MPSQDAGLYRIEAVVWTGETAEICRAVAPNGERVAIKRIRRDIRKGAAFRSLEREAQIGLCFDHPNIVRVHELLPGPPEPLMVMEFFPSRNLKMRVLDRRGDPLLGTRTADILLQMAAALLHVHQRGYIHMDIKPENYLLSDEGQVKLTDFAIACRVPTGLLRFLPMRRISGTRPYIAPETLRRKRPDFRTDIYSFGATVFEVLAKRPPFVADDRDELLVMHLSRVPPWPWTFNKNITREINDLILSMLEKDPGRRPQSMDDVLARLKRVRVYENPPSEAEARGTKA